MSKKKLRILCIVPSTARNEMTKAKAVMDTWGSRCNKLLFVFAKHRSIFNHISLNVTDSRRILTAKTMEAFKFIYRQYIDEFDWIVKADDDTYLILENLRLLLSKFDPNEPAYIGYHFKLVLKHGFMSGGASYVLSKKALRMLVENGVSEEGGCVQNNETEDVEVGRCMELLGVKPYITRDKLGRDTFHPQSLEDHLIGPLPWYLKFFPAVPAKLGPECCSQYSISFHYVKPEVMYVMDFLLYRMNVHGKVDLPHDQLQELFEKKVSVIKSSPYNIL